MGWSVGTTLACPIRKRGRVRDANEVGHLIGAVRCFLPPRERTCQPDRAGHLAQCLGPLKALLLSQRIILLEVPGDDDHRQS
jgi:hypothetical protein